MPADSLTGAGAYQTFAYDQAGHGSGVGRLTSETFSEPGTSLSGGALPLAETIAAWTSRNLRDSRGFFYYQRRRFYTVRTPFIRWTQAWMLYALARLLEERIA